MVQFDLFLSSEPECCHDYVSEDHLRYRMVGGTSLRVQLAAELVYDTHIRPGRTTISCSETQIFYMTGL